MIGKPFLYKFGLMNAVVIKDDMDPHGRVESDDIVEEFYDLFFPFMIGDMT